MTLRADVVEELISDTMLEVWKAGESIRTNASVLLAIMTLAYSRVQQYFVEVRIDEPSGCSRRETADVMKIACDCVDVLLCAVRASATLYYGVTSAHSHGID
jgi:hypothetical protein